MYNTYIFTVLGENSVLFSPVCSLTPSVVLHYFFSPPRHRLTHGCLTQAHHGPSVTQKRLSIVSSPAPTCHLSASH